MNKSFSQFHRNIFMEITSGDYPTHFQRVKRLSQAVYQYYEGKLSKEESIGYALDLYDSMTNYFFDPTRSEYVEILNSIL